MKYVFTMAIQGEGKNESAALVDAITSLAGCLFFDQNIESAGAALDNMILETRVVDEDG